MTSTPSPSPGAASIAVVGAGPGGLTAARILQQHGIQVTVYERDSRCGSRNQGGSLDLRAEDGQRALTEAGLIDRFHELARPEGQEMRQFTPTTAEIVFHHLPKADEQEKPEIDRAELRTLLLESVAPSTVRWNTHVRSVEDDRDAGSGTIVRFADGSTAHHDLVIGAEGASSRVRKALSRAEPSYTGVTFIEAWFDDVAKQHPWLDQFCGGGAAAGADGSRGLFAQRNSGDHIRVYIMLKAPLDQLKSRGLLSGDTETVRRALLHEFSGWDPRLSCMITDNDGPFVPRPISYLPIAHRWPHSPSRTLIGDAAHLMPPVGVGVNLAMLDACELALALAEYATVDDAVRAYEDVMWARSAEYSGLAHEMFTMLLNGAPPPSQNEASSAHQPQGGLSEAVSPNCAQGSKQASEAIPGQPDVVE